MAVVNVKEVRRETGALRSRPSSVNSTGCQSGAYFISKRETLKSSGAWVDPVEVTTHREEARSTRACSRPICAPRRKMPNEASPLAGVDAGCCADAKVAARTKAAADAAVQ